MCTRTIGGNFEFCHSMENKYSCKGTFADGHYNCTIPFECKKPDVTYQSMVGVTPVLSLQVNFRNEIYAGSPARHKNQWEPTPVEISPWLYLNIDSAIYLKVSFSQSWAAISLTEQQEGLEKNNFTLSLPIPHWEEQYEGGKQVLTKENRDQEFD